MSSGPKHKKPLGKPCPFCDDFGTRNVYMKAIVFNEWAPGIQSSQCQYCKVLVQAFRQLHPKFLPGACDNGPRPNEGVSLSIKTRRGRVSVSVEDSREVPIVHPNFTLYMQIFFSRDERQSIAPSLSHIPILGEIPPVAGDQRMWSFIKDSLHDCLKKHEECRDHQIQGWFPRRLLHLGHHEDGTENLRLVQTAGLGKDVRYLALSHCWGPKLPVRTTHDNLHRSMSNIPVVDLPRTFQDCLSVARELGVAYVWIDALCIIQDDKDDWAEQAAIMDKVYENALVTVSAISCDSGGVPFLGPEAPSKRALFQATELYHHDMANIKVRIPNGGVSPGEVYGPLESRAWTYQERHLSTRIVFFAEDEVYWHCKAKQTCECVGALLEETYSERASSPPHSTETDPMRLWRWTIHRYSERSLTYGTDRLPALSGIASRASSTIKSSYVAGLWAMDIHRQLAWFKPGNMDNHRCLDNGVPSWSWASVPGKVFFLWENKDLLGYPDAVLHYTAKLYRVRCAPKSGNLFGEVEPGSYIKLRSQVVEAEMESDTHGAVRILKTGFKPQLALPDCCILDPQAVRSKKRTMLSRTQGYHRRANPSDPFGPWLPESQTTKTRVLCFLLFTAIKEFEKFDSETEEYPCILILGKHDWKSNAYQRLGIAGREFPWQSHFIFYDDTDKGLWEAREELGKWDNWKDWFAGAKTRTVKII